MHLRVRLHGPIENNWTLRQQVFSAQLNTQVETSVAKNILDIHGFAPGRYQLDRSGGGQSDSERTLDLTGDTEIDGAEAPTQLQVRGTVVSHESPGRVPGGVRIRLFNLQSGLEVDARISPKNEFQFEGSLIPGLYSISCLGSPRIVVGTVSAKGATVSGHTVTIPENGQVQLTVALERGIQIDGMAQRNGKPVSGAMIVLVPEDPSHNLVLFRRDQSDSDGTFSLYDVLQGRYTLLALENAWDVEWANASVLERYLKVGKVLQVRTDGNGGRVTVEAQ
jgi:hypothetical protein